MVPGMTLATWSWSVENQAAQEKSKVIQILFRFPTSIQILKSPLKSAALACSQILIPSKDEFAPHKIVDKLAKAQKQRSPCDLTQMQPSSTDTSQSTATNQAQALPTWNHFPFPRPDCHLNSPKIQIISYPAIKSRLSSKIHVS